MTTTFSSVVSVAFVGMGPDRQQLVLTAHVGTQDGVSGSEVCCTANVGTLFDYLMGPILPFMQGLESYTHVKSVARVVAGTGLGAVIEDFTDAGTHNSGTGGPANLALAALMTKHSAMGGRKGYGRLFIPFAPDNCFSVNGVQNFATYGAIGDITGAWTNAISLEGTEASFNVDQIIWHRGTATGEIVTSCTFGTLMGVQRRRRVGIGA